MVCSCEALYRDVKRKGTLRAGLLEGSISDKTGAAELSELLSLPSQPSNAGSGFRGRKSSQPNVQSEEVTVECFLPTFAEIAAFSLFRVLVSFTLSGGSALKFFPSRCLI